MTLQLNKVHCMDCIEGMRLLSDNSVDLIVTDPPYGIDFQSSWRIGTERFDKIQGDNAINTEFLDDCYRVLKDTCAIYVFTRWDVYPQWLQAIQERNFIVKNCIVWDRMNHGLGDLEGAYAPIHDFCIFATKGRHILKGNRPKDILHFQRPSPETLLHPTQKPLALIQHLIGNSSEKGNIVLDPYMGSGTTALAAKVLGMDFIGFEINPDYVVLANKRLNQESLKKWFL